MYLESIYQEAKDFRSAGADFGEAGSRHVFASLTVYVEFLCFQPGRQMTRAVMPGYEGTWVAAYSSLRRLRLAVGNDEVEYSAMTGANVLAQKPASAGVWFDPWFRGGRPIALPAPSIAWDL